MSKVVSLSSINRETLYIVHPITRRGQLLERLDNLNMQTAGRKRIKWREINTVKSI